MDAFHLFLVYAGYAAAAFGVLFASITALRDQTREIPLNSPELYLPVLRFVAFFLIALVAAILHRMID